MTVTNTDLKVSSCLCLWVGVTRQDNALFGVLYSPMYIDFLSKVCVCVSVGDGGAHSVLGLGQI